LPHGSPKRWKRQKAEQEALATGRRRRIRNLGYTIAIMLYQLATAKSPQVPVCVKPSAQTQRPDHVIDVHGTNALTCQEVEVNSKRGSTDDRKHLNEPVRRKIESHDTLVWTRISARSHDLYDYGVDAPEIFDVIDDEPVIDKPVKPSNDATVRHSQHPCEVVHLQSK